MAKESAAEQDLSTVEIPRDLLRKLGDIADYRDITRFEALEKYGGPGILREYKKVLDEKNAEFGEAGA